MLVILNKNRYPILDFIFYRAHSPPPPFDCLDPPKPTHMKYNIG